MNCFIHEDRIAVATCLNCGKGMCAECASFFDTTGQNNGHCPTCRRNDIQSEKNSVERVRNDLWIRAAALKRKSRHRALNIFSLGLFLTAVILILEYVAKVDLLRTVGIATEPLKLPFGISLTLNTLASVIPFLICSVIALIILLGNRKRGSGMVIQGDAYEVTRYNLDMSVRAVDTAVVKNRSNTRRL